MNRILEPVNAQGSAMLDWMQQMAPYGILTTDSSLRIQSWNQWLEVHTGRLARTVNGRFLFDVFPDLPTRGLDTHFIRALAGEVSVLATGLHRYLIPMAPTSDEVGYAQMQQTARIAPLGAGDDVLGTITVIEDVTMREFHAATVRRQQEHDRLLSWALARLMQAADPLHELAEIFAAVALSLRFELYLNYQLERESGTLRLHASGGLLPAQRKKIEALAVGQGVCGRAAALHIPIVIDHLLDNTDPEAAHLRELGMSAYAAYPLVIGERLIGTLSFATSNRPILGQDELEFLPRLAQYVAIAIDRKQRETALVVAQQSLSDHAGLLETKIAERTARLHETIVQLESFSYTVAHDLRAPIRSLRGYCDVLLDDYGAEMPAEARDLLHRMLRAGTRLDALTRDLLQFSKVSRMDLELAPVDLDELVQELLHCTPAWQRAVVTVRTPLGQVQAQRTMLQQCLSNLIDNAVKFARPDAPPEITLWTELRPAEGAGPGASHDAFIPAAHAPRESTPGSSSGLPVPNATGAPRVRIWIEDNGIGIPALAHGKIFGIFERVSGVGSIEGTGIGLAIVARAIQRMGGAYGVESSLGAGSQFWLELPPPENVPPAPAA